MDATNAKSNIQKKMLVYARDIALDKLNKKLDKKLAKQIRKKENDGVLYQRCSQNSDCVGTNSELTSSSSDTAPLVHSKEKLAASTSTVEPEKIFFPQQILNKHNGDLDRSISGTDSSGQDEEYQTADEDEEENEELVKKKDVSQTCTKPNELNGIAKNNDFIVDIDDDKNDKLVIKPALPQGQAHSPHSTSGTSVDYSGYIQKKSLAQGMMDLALVSANTNQLRYIIEYKDHHPYFVTSLSLVIASLFLQLAVGMTLIWNTRFNVKKRKEMQEADKVNNFSVIGIFIVTLINVFLSTFGGAPQSTAVKPPTATLAQETSNPASDPIILH